MTEAEAGTLHVRLIYFDGVSRVRLVRLGLSEVQLRQQVADPWLKAQPLQVGGRTMQRDMVREIHVTSGEVASHLRTTSWYAGNRESAEWQAAARCTDVTERFLNWPGVDHTHPAELPISADVDSRRVFVVYGRNVAARDAMYAFLNSVGLTPVAWLPTVTGRPSPSVAEVLDALFRSAHAVVILFTGDDEARLLPQFRGKSDPPYESRLTPQARPNVLFEAGLAFGSHPDRTVLAELGFTRPFSDLGGRYTVRLDDSRTSRLDLAKRLEVCGCPVDVSGKGWLRAGNFGKAMG